MKDRSGVRRTVRKDPLAGRDIGIDDDMRDGHWFAGLQAVRRKDASHTDAEKITTLFRNPGGACFCIVDFGGLSLVVLGMLVPRTMVRVGRHGSMVVRPA